MTVGNWNIAVYGNVTGYLTNTAITGQQDTLFTKEFTASGTGDCWVWFFHAANTDYNVYVDYFSLKMVLPDPDPETTKNKFKTFPINKDFGGW